MTLWVVRAGEHGEQEEVVVKNSIVSIEYNEFADFSKIPDKSSLKKLFKEKNTKKNDRSLQIHSDQMWSFIYEIKIGDLVLLPSKLSYNVVYVGKISGDYEYKKYSDNVIHTRTVEWSRKITKSEFSKDIKKVLDRNRTVYSLKVKGAENEIINLLKQSLELNDKTQYFLVQSGSFGSPHVLKNGFYQHVGWQYRARDRDHGKVKVGDILLFYFASKSILYKKSLKRIYQVKSITKGNVKFYLTLWKDLNGIPFDKIKASIANGKLAEESFRGIGTEGLNIKKINKEDFDAVLELDKERGVITDEDKIKPNLRFIIANITWNETGWRTIYINPKAGHRYAREHPGHESLNFKFDKNDLDTEKNVFGYVQWVGAPKKLGKNSVIFFYTKNLKNQKNEIVGVYGNVKILKPVIRTKYEGFEDDFLISNVEADKELSTLFSIPLDANKYSANARLVPQAGFTYVDLDLATKILSDEIELLKKSGARKEEYEKNSKIYEYVSNKKYDMDIEYLENEKEQQDLDDEMQDSFKNDPEIRNKILQELKTITPQSPEIITINGKSYKRDYKTITNLKIIRGFKCQICDITIAKKNGDFYIEAAHIKRKSEKGPETPENILILCPNHHKEFDVGKTKIIKHDLNEIVLEMNGKTYPPINLAIE